MPLEDKQKPDMPSEPTPLKRTPLSTRRNERNERGACGIRLGVKND